MQNPAPKDLHDQYNAFVYPTKGPIQLSRAKELPKASFIDVLQHRRSSFGKMGQPSHDLISELLFRGMEIDDVTLDQQDFLTSKRRSPSAGGRHPIDILVSLPAESLVERQLAYYNPIQHSQAELDFSADLISSFFVEVDANVAIGETCVLWFSIQTEKTLSKYNNPESLYWRDAGALLYCFQLIATYLGLKTKPIGTLAAESYRKMFDMPSMISGGGLLVGI